MHLQNLDFKDQSIHAQSDPPDAGNEHLDEREDGYSGHLGALCDLMCSVFPQRKLNAIETLRPRILYPLDASGCSLHKPRLGFLVLAMEPVKLVRRSTLKRAYWNSKSMAAEITP